MICDEWVFHRRRGLRLWERVSHPMDAVIWAIALAWLLFIPPGPRAAWIYVVLLLLSSLLITKDEWIHARECCGEEQWLHALLFILHPTLLIVGGAPSWGLWPILHSAAPVAELARLALGVQIVLALSFAGYQIVYWRNRRRNAWVVGAAGKIEGQ